MTAPELSVSPTLALQIIGSRPCEHSTTGRCPEHYSPLARYGAEKMCDPCVARLGLAFQSEEGNA